MLTLIFVNKLEEQLMEYNNYSEGLDDIKKRQKKYPVCECGFKYVKTRPDQTKCLICMRVESRKKEQNVI